MEDGDTEGWDPYGGTLGTLKTNDGFSRWGVDRLTLLLPAMGEIRGQVVRGTRGAYVSTRKGVLRVDFNPAQVSSEAWHPCPMGDVPETVALVLTYLDEVLGLGPYSKEEMANARITRVDLTRDLEGVAHASKIIDALARLPRPRGLRAETYNNGRITWRPNGLAVGTGNEAVLYDRSVLYRSADDWALKERRRGRGIEVPEGVVRFEARFRDNWLKRAAFVRLSDLTEGRALQALRDRWRWARFGSPVTDEAGLVEAIAAMGWGARAKADHLWFEATRRPGRDPETSPRKRREHRRRLAEVGIGAVLAEVAEVRLDLDLGTEALGGRQLAALGTEHSRLSG